MNRPAIEKLKSILNNGSFSLDKLKEALSKYSSDKPDSISNAEKILNGKKNNEMRGGSDLNKMVIAYYFENVNKFDEALIAKGEMIGLNHIQLFILFFLYGAKDLAEFCRDSGISMNHYIELLGFKKASALYNINHNF